jgi:hypothetical protein
MGHGPSCGSSIESGPAPDELNDDDVPEGVDR